MYRYIARYIQVSAIGTVIGHGTCEVFAANRIDLSLADTANRAYADAADAVVREHCATGAIIVTSLVEAV